MKKVIATIAIAGSALALAACGSEEGDAGSEVASVITKVIPKNEFIKVQETCETKTQNRPVFDYTEAGISGTVQPNYNFEMDVFYCVISEMEPNNILISQIEQTNAMMGIQNYDDNKTGKTFIWSYHPDNGLYFAVENTN